MKLINSFVHYSNLWVTCYGVSVWIMFQAWFSKSHVSKLFWPISSGSGHCSISSEMLRTPPQTYVRSSCHLGYIGFTCCILWVDLTLSWGLCKLRRKVKGAVLHWWIRGNRILMLSQFFLLVTWPLGTMIYFSPLWGGVWLVKTFYKVFNKIFYKDKICAESCTNQRDATQWFIIKWISV